MFNKDEIVIDLSIEKIIFNGFGLAHHQGSNILVFQGIPGDIVDAVIIHKRGDTYFGNIVSYKKRSDLQIPVTCPHFDNCGGCDWLHLPYQAQLDFKQQVTEDEYTRLLSGTNLIKRIIPSPEKDYYRNKVILPVTEVDGQVKTGMYVRRSHQVIPHHNCMLHPAKSDALFALTEQLLTDAKVPVFDEHTGKGNLRFIGIRHSYTRNEFLLILVTKSSKLPFTKILVENLSQAFPSLTGVVQDINSEPSNRNLSSNYKTLYGNDYLVEDIAGISLKIHYSSFFQINTGQCLNVVSYINDLIKEGATVLDAYSGIGTFGIPLAKKAKQVICLEQHSQAVANGLFNIRENGLDNCRYIAGGVEDTLPNILSHHKPDTIIFDPPRKGLERSVIESLEQSTINKIIYLSCNISTQKRDIEMMIRMGFSVELIQPFDMFPHTHHIESLAVLSR